MQNFYIHTLLKNNFTTIIQLLVVPRDLTVIKTTQSAFVNFVADEYRTLPDAEDRIFSTIGKTWPIPLTTL